MSQCCHRNGGPPQFAVIESWLRPRILASHPKFQREWVDLRAQSGVSEFSNVLMFYLFKFFAPGSPNDKDNLLKKVLNPLVCSNPQSAQIELMRWRADVHRLRAFGCMPPDLTVSYRAMESSFGIVFDNAEPQLHMRWILLKLKLGPPPCRHPDRLPGGLRLCQQGVVRSRLARGYFTKPGLTTDRQSEGSQLAAEGERQEGRGSPSSCSLSCSLSSSQRTSSRTSPSRHVVRCGAAVQRHLHVGQAV